MNDVTIHNYQALAMRTAKSCGSVSADLNHAALGLASEWFEYQDAGGEEHENEEIGDFCWYLALACNTLGVEFKQSMPIPAADISVNERLGNFISQVKRVVIYGRPLDGMIRADMVFNLRRLCWYMNEVYNIDEILQQNIDKLRKRYPDAYSDEAAEARADKGGVDAMNS